MSSISAEPRSRSEASSCDQLYGVNQLAMEKFVPFRVSLRKLFAAIDERAGFPLVPTVPLPMDRYKLPSSSAAGAPPAHPDAGFLAVGEVLYTTSRSRVAAL